MRNIFCIVIAVFLATVAQGQAKRVYSSDTLDVYIDSVLKKSDERYTKMRFASYFDDSIRVVLKGKCLFSRRVKPDSTVLSTDADLTAPYINLPKYGRNSLLRIILVKEKAKYQFQFIPGYNYLYAYRQNKKLTLYFTNDRITFD